ncbi:hypothetical protein RQP46_001886 [Phenoliferia psychrophenolica]
MPRHRPRTTITSLPTELISFVVHISCPPPDWTPARSSHLLRLSLVSHAFRGPAQQELFRHVLLPTITASQSFVAVLKSRGGARFAPMVRDLRIGTETGDEGWMGGEVDQEKWGLQFLARKLGRVEEMWLLEIGPLDLKVVAGPLLKRLHCRSCRFLPSITRPKRAPKLALTRLTLSHCDGVSFIRASSLPSLTSLALTSERMFGEHIPWDHDVELPPSPITSLAPQLSHLCLDATTSFNLSPYFSHLTSLTTLDTRFLWDHEPLEFLLNLPSRLLHLRACPTQLDDTLWDPTGTSHALAFLDKHIVDRSYDSLADLKHLRLSGACIVRPQCVERLLDRDSASEDILLTFDDDREWKNIESHHQGWVDGYDSEGILLPQVEEEKEVTIDDKFNSEFWALVDDAEGGLILPE